MPKGRGGKFVPDTIVETEWDKKEAVMQCKGSWMEKQGDATFKAKAIGLRQKINAKMESLRKAMRAWEKDEKSQKATLSEAKRLYSFCLCVGGG